MKGEFVEEYTPNDDVPPLVWSYDKEGTQIISDAEMEQRLLFLGLENYDNWKSGLACIMNPEYTNRTYNNKLEDYYPHPWYPDKEIESFECIRMSVYWTKGIRYEVFVENDGYLIEGDDHETRVWLSEALDFPEFFKPIYKGDSL
jgi:hypothetical protein